jgi:hypothetical protein
MNETKWYKIWPRLKGWVQKMFWTLLTNFVKRLNKSGLKCCPFCMDKSENNRVKVSFMLKKALFSQPSKFEKICQTVLPNYQNILIFSGTRQYFMVFNKIQWELTKFYEIWWKFLGKNYALIQFCSILGFLAFAFDILESLPQSFGLVLTLLNFQNFEFSDGER